MESKLAMWLCAIVLTIICISQTQGYAIRSREEKARLQSALKRIDRMLETMLSADLDKSSLADTSKRNEDGPLPYKRNEDGPVPYKRNPEGPVPYKIDGSVPYKRNPEYAINAALKRNEDGPVPYKRKYDDETLNEVLRYLLRLEDEAELQAKKRDLDVPFPY